MIGVIALNTGVHLLPTLELLGLLGGLVLFNAYSDFLERKLGVPAAVASLLIPIVALAGVVLNPAFSSMRKISENDGTSSFLNITYPTGIATLCVLGVILSLVLLALHVKNKPMLGYPAVKYLALYGGAVSCLCLLQMVLVKYGMGSDYAVKNMCMGSLPTSLFRFQFCWVLYFVARRRMIRIRRIITRCFMLCLSPSAFMLFLTHRYRPLNLTISRNWCG